jgi:hypothetical protein
MSEKFENNAIEVEVRGMDRLIRRYDKLGKDLKPELESTMGEAGIMLLSQIPDYPPQVIGSGYVRTGTLGRLWTSDTEVLGNDVVGIIGNNTGYGPWVVSDEVSKVNSAGPQAWFHKGKWWIIQDVVRDNAQQVFDLFREMVRRLLRESGR